MKIGKILINNGHINKRQLNEALRKQQKANLFYNEHLMIGKALIELKHIDVTKLTEALNKQNERS